jgi:hypothetical protein
MGDKQALSFLQVFLLNLKFDIINLEKIVLPRLTFGLVVLFESDFRKKNKTEMTIKAIIT